MSRERLSNRLGAGFDPCAALQSSFELAAGDTQQRVHVHTGFASNLVTGPARPILGKTEPAAPWGMANRTTPEPSLPGAHLGQSKRARPEVFG